MSDFKQILLNKLKSSPRFGDLFVNKNIQEILKERRFLFFTKNGPIEIVFNIKHYISGFFLTLLVVFKFIQFALFGVINIVTSLMIQNNNTQVQQFTKSEVEVLKELAENVIEVEPSIVEEISIPNNVNSIQYLDETKNERFGFLEVCPLCPQKFDV